MEYQYNYSFLSEWIKANPNIQVKTILKTIGSKSNNSLRSWEQRLCAMPVITLLRFCNAFQVPISAFLYNTGEPCKTKVDISDTAQFEPEGGYTTDPSKRLPGERKPLSPTNVTIIAKQQEQIRDLTKLLQEEREKSKPSGYKTIAEP